MWTTKTSKPKPPSPIEADIHVEFTDADLEDPSLLAELQGLMGTEKPVAKAAPKPSAKAVNVDEILSALPKDEDIKVEFTEKDMQDPELLVMCLKG
jgi:hypothetical protein